MSIAERFAQYTTEEIRNGIAHLNKKIAEAESCMNTFKAENDVEFYKVAKEDYDRLIEKLMDAECALAARA